jgi:hypothetical protein
MEASLSIKAAGIMAVVHGAKKIENINISKMRKKCLTK